MKAVADSTPTIKDVARRANVATGTVSRVVNGDPTVHPVIRTAVEAAIRELDYRPSPMARNLRTGKTSIIGFVVCDLKNPTYAPAVSVVQELAREAGYTVIVADSQMDRAIEEKNLERLADLRVDGIVWTPIFPMSPDVPRYLSKVAVVTVPNGAVRAFVNVPVDTATATLEALERLIAHGHRRVALVTQRGLYGRGGPLMPKIVDRLTASGGEMVSDSSWTFSTREECQQALPGKLTAAGRPTALFVASSLLPAALLALRETQLRIPDDISVVSIGDSELAEVFDPPIDAVHYSYDDCATAATKLLFAVMSGVDRAELQIPQKHATFIPRESVGPPAGKSIRRD